MLDCDSEMPELVVEKHDTHTVRRFENGDGRLVCGLYVLKDGSIHPDSWINRKFGCDNSSKVFDSCQ